MQRIGKSFMFTRIVRSLAQKLRTGLVLGLITGLSSAASTANEDTQKASVFYERARSLYADNQLQAALIEVRNALASDQKYLPARQLAGEIYLRQGKGAEAESQLQEARSAGADVHGTTVLLAQAYYLQGKYREIVDQMFVSASASNSAKADVGVLRGRAFLALGEVDKAEREFVEAGRFDPARVDPLLGRANVARLRGDLPQTLSILDGAAKISADNADIWHFRAELSRVQRELDAALGYYNRALDSNPSHMQSRIGRAATLIDLQRDQDARRDLDYVLADLPGDAQANYLLALTMTRAGQVKEAKELLGKTEEALSGLESSFLANHAPSLLLFGTIAYAQNEHELAYAHLKRFSELDQNHAGARKLLAAILLRRNEPLPAINLIEPLLRANANDPELYGVLGEAEMLRGVYRRARQRFEQAVALAPDDPQLKAQLAISKLLLGDRGTAEKELEQAYNASANNTQLGLLLGRVYYERGAYNETIRISKRLYEADPSNPGPYNLAGIAQLGRRNLRAARVAFELALRADPTYQPARLNLAKVAEVADDLSLAEKLYRQAAEESPRDRRANAALAQFLERQGRVKEAIEAYEKLPVGSPESTRYLVSLVNLYLIEERNTEASSLARELEGKFPESAPVLLARARVQIADDAVDLAQSTLRRAARFAGADYRALYQVGKMQLEAQDSAGAYSTFQNAVAANSEFVAAKRELALINLQRGEFEAGMAHAQQIIESMPDSAEGFSLAGEISMAQKKFLEATRHFNKAFAKKPSPELANALYYARRENGDQAEALADLERQLQQFPSAKSVMHALAAGYLEQGDTARAVSKYEALLTRDPDNPVVFNNLAWLYFQKKDPRALEFAKRAHSAGPDNPVYLDTLGWLLFDTGDAKGALEYLRQAQTRATEAPDIRFHLAAVLAAQGRAGEARRELELALKSPVWFAERADAEALSKRLAKD